MTVTSSCEDLTLEQTNITGFIFSTLRDYYKYKNNMECKWGVSSNTKLELTFYTFKTEEDKDILEIYDGSSSNSPLIGSYSGTSLPPPITSSSHELYIVFSTDYSDREPGFQASYRGGLDPRVLKRARQTTKRAANCKNYQKMT